MKKIYYILFAVLLSTTSCSDFLEQDNKSNVPTNDFYTTRAGYESLINAVYSSLRTVYGNEPWVFSAGTDLYSSGRNRVPDGLGTYRGLIDSDANVRTFYQNCYAGIQLANTAVHYAELTEQFDQLPRLRAEARFIRAHYYYLLVQQFGGVPLVTEMFDSPVVTFERETAEAIYSFVIAEMEDLINNLPARTTETGKVDQKTVNHFLAKTYLCRGYETFGSASDFDRAAQYADAAIAGDVLSLTFNDLFWPTNENNSEVIWSVQYSLGSISNPLTDGNMQQSYFGTYLNGSEAGHKYTTSTLTPTLRLHELFTEGDSRYEGTFMVELYRAYYDLYTQTSDLDNVEVTYYYPPAWEVADTAAWRAANPATRANAVIIPMQANTLTVNGTPTSYESAMTGDVYGVACVRKFDDPNSLFSTRGSMRDIVLARTGETYLVAAEAYLQAGDRANALNRINEVRRRAAEPGYNLSITDSDLSIDFILDERGRELAGEYHRWMDLKRTGKLIDYCVAYNPEVLNADFFRGTDGQNKILRPIPRDAIDLNNADVQQNPGY